MSPEQLAKYRAMTAEIARSIGAEPPNWTDQELVAAVTAMGPLAEKTFKLMMEEVVRKKGDK